MSEAELYLKVYAIIAGSILGAMFILWIVTSIYEFIGNMARKRKKHYQQYKKNNHGKISQHER